MKNLMQRTKFSTTILLALVLLAGCGATIQQQWAGLTPDERGRIVLSGVQDQLRIMWNSGQAYVKANPQYAEEWTKKIVPAFSTANQAVIMYIGMVSGGTMTAEAVLIKIEPLVKAISDLLKGIGASPTGGK